MGDVDGIAKQFVTTYYQTFDTNRAGLTQLYVNESVLIFEGAAHKGPEEITKKLVSLPFKVIQHAVTTVDSVLTIDQGLLVMVMGQLKTDDDPAHSFTQSFYLKQIGDSLFIMNDIFRLGLHHS